MHACGTARKVGAHIPDVAGGHPGLAVHVLVAQVLPEAAHAAALGPQGVVRGAGLAAAVPEVHVQMNRHVHDVRQFCVHVAIWTNPKVQACTSSRRLNQSLSKASRVQQGGRTSVSAPSAGLHTKAWHENSLNKMTMRDSMQATVLLKMSILRSLHLE